MIFARKTLTAAALTAVLAFGFSGLLRAQQPDRSPGGVPGMQMKTFDIQYADASELVGTLQGLLRGTTQSFRIISDARSNKIVVYGPNDLVLRTTEMIDNLDVKVESVDHRLVLETAILPVVNRPVAALRDTLKLQLGRNGRMAVDPARNVLILKDEAAAIVRARDLMRDLDVAPVNLSLQFLVLGPSGSDLTSVPDARSVVAELESMGLRGYGVVGRAAISVLESEDFATEGGFLTGELKLKGVVRLVAEDRLAEILLDAGVNMRGTGAGRAKLTSTLTIPLGHLMVVGLAPAGGEGHEPIVLVVRATVSNPKIR